MANPQLEHGHIRIANDIWKALRSIRIPGESMQCLLFIIEKTYGWQKKEDRIAIGQFAEATGIRKTHIKRSIDKLVEMNIVTKKGNELGITYSLNKNYESWESLPKKGTVPIIGQKVPKKGYKSYPIKGNTKDNKDTNKKQYAENSSEFQLFTFSIDKIKQNFPALKFDNGIKKKSLDMFEKLIRIDGFSEAEIKTAIEYAANHKTERFSWAEQFQSPLKLRKKNKEGLSYMQVWLSKAAVIKQEELPEREMVENPDGSFSWRVKKLIEKSLS